MAADGLLFFPGSAHSDQLLLPWESSHGETFPLSLSSSNFPLLSSHHHHLPSHFPPSHRPCYDVILVITFRVLFKDYFKLIQNTILEVRDICWTGKIFNHIDNYVSGVGLLLSVRTVLEESRSRLPASEAHVENNLVQKTVLP